MQHNPRLNSAVQRTHNHIPRSLETTLCFEEVQGFPGRAVIHRDPLGQEKEIVKQSVDGEPRLVDGEDDGATFPRQPVRESRG